MSKFSSTTSKFIRKSNRLTTAKAMTRFMKQHNNLLKQHGEEILSIYVSDFSVVSPKTDFNLLFPCRELTHEFFIALNQK